MRILLVVLLLFCLYPAAYAQDDTPAPDTVSFQYAPEDGDRNEHVLVAPHELETSEVYQSEELEVRKFDEDKWKAIVNAVNYDEEKEEKPEKEETQKAAAPWGGRILKVVSFVVIAAVLIAVIYYVTRSISLDSKIERSELDTGDLDAPVEDIAELDIARLLEQAKRDGNYKLAVRLYYLDLLKKLNDKGAIVWKKDKTNREYLTELFAADLFFNEVRRLTLSYEAVWYGDHDLTAETFQFLKTQFESINGKINMNEKS